MDELSCVPETQQTQQAAGVELVWEWRILWRCQIQNRVTLGFRHDRIRIQVMMIHRTHKLLGDTEGQGKRQGQG